MALEEFPPSWVSVRLVQCLTVSLSMETTGTPWVQGGIQAVINTYRQTLEGIELSGPSEINPILEKFLE